MLCERGFDTRIICTVNRVNIQECTNLLTMADEIGVNLVKYHVFSVEGLGKANPQWAVKPDEWIEFYERLEQQKGMHRTQIWYQPTYARKARLQKFAAEGFRVCVG